jgi:hypothetical protein
MFGLPEIALVVIVLLLLWVFVSQQSLVKKESLIGNDLFDDGIYTSGATMRRLGQIFTSTDQGAPITIYNKENKNEKLHVLLKKVGEI